MTSLQGHEFILTALGGALAGREYVILGDEIRVGRTPENDIVVTDRSISRHHASFWIQQGELWISDMQSKNGVFVNDRKVESSKLEADDTVKLGEAKFRVSVGKSALTKTSGKMIAAAITKWPAAGELLERFGIKRLLMYGTALLVVGLALSTKNRSAENTSPAPDKTSRASLIPLPKRPPVQASSAQAEEWIGRAEQALRYDDVTTAIPLLQDAVSVHPEDTYAREMLVRAQLRLSELIHSYYEAGVRKFEKSYHLKAIEEWNKVLALSKDYDADMYRRTQEKIREVRKKLSLTR